MHALRIIIALFFIGNCVNAQEVLSPLEMNSKLYLNSLNKQEKAGAIHNNFIYLFDTVQLPFIDDFTFNNFPKFNAQTTDSNVDDSTWFALSQGGMALAWGSSFSADTTFRLEYDTVPGEGFDSIVLNKIPLASTFIDVADIDNYPVITTTEEVWPSYDIVDSLWNSANPDDTIFQSNPSFTQDSATVYFVSETTSDANVLWQDTYAYHNYTYATNIQTLGVVTFDGLDENGYPYDFTSPSAEGLADVLTSKVIDLSANQPQDSLYFSMLYQCGGHGEAPENTDSLVVEFWSPLFQTWNSVANVTGNTNPDFHQILIPITDPGYFFNSFQFRIKSYGTLTGSLDVWHIDYVELNELRSFTDTLTNDWAFSEPSPSLINDYTSMPWNHYEYDPNTPLKPSVSVKTYNSDPNDIFISPSYAELFHESNLLHTENYIITNPNVSGSTFFDMDYTWSNGFWFDTIYADTCAVFNVKYNLATNTLNDLDINDTLYHQQVFENYYSLDDGTAEGAYGIIGNSAKVGQQYYMPSGLTDTLRAVQIHFSPSVNDVSNETFFIEIYDDFSGEPGNVIYTTDDANLPILFSPEYTLENNGFFEYELPEKVAVQGVYYVVLRQTGADRLNVGFDKNINNQDKVFYATSSNWSTTGFEGTLMIRPVFVNDKDNIVSVERLVKENVKFNLFPNPATDVVRIQSSDYFSGSVSVINLQGQVLMNEQFSDQEQMNLNTSSLPNGTYIVQITTSKGVSTQEKLVVLH